MQPGYVLSSAYISFQIIFFKIQHWNTTFITFHVNTNDFYRVCNQALKLVREILHTKRMINANAVTNFTHSSLPR